MTAEQLRAIGVYVWLVPLGLAALAWIVWDLYVVLVARKPGGTLSALVIDKVLAAKPWQTLVLGLCIAAPIFFLLGHLIWPQVRCP